MSNRSNSPIPSDKVLFDYDSLPSPTANTPSPPTPTQPTVAPLPFPSNNPFNPARPLTSAPPHPPFHPTNPFAPRPRRHTTANTRPHTAAITPPRPSTPFHKRISSSPTTSTSSTSSTSSTTSLITLSRPDSPLSLLTRRSMSADNALGLLLTASSDDDGKAATTGWGVVAGPTVAEIEASWAREVQARMRWEREVQRAEEAEAWKARGEAWLAGGIASPTRPRAAQAADAGVVPLRRVRGVRRERFARGLKRFFWY